VEGTFNESDSNTPNSKTTVEGSMEKAKRVLAGRPDSARLGRLIDEKTRAAKWGKGSGRIEKKPQHLILFAVGLSYQGVERRAWRLLLGLPFV